MIFNVPQDKLIQKTADELKKLVHMPSWAPFVKTGTHKDRPPVDPDWWYVRSAAVLRKVHLYGPIGVAKLRVKYGGKKNRGMKPERFYKGSGSVLRKVLQQLEEAKLIKQATIGKHKGRVITPKGTSLLFSTAKSMGGALRRAPKLVPKDKTKETKKPGKQDHVIPKEKQLMSEPKVKKKSKVEKEVKSSEEHKIKKETKPAKEVKDKKETTAKKDKKK